MNQEMKDKQVTDYQNLFSCFNKTVITCCNGNKISYKARKVFIVTFSASTIQ